MSNEFNGFPHKNAVAVLDSTTNQYRALQVDDFLGEGGFILTGNSYSTPISSNASYTGTYVDVSNYSSVLTAVKTDKSGILYMQFSPDGTNWDSSLSFFVASGTNEVHRLSVTRQYYRTAFTNTSASNQNYFRLQTMVGAQTALSSPFNGIVQQDADALAVRSRSEEIDIAAGLYDGYSLIHKFGRNPDVDGPEDIWNGGGVYLGFPTGNSGEYVNIYSSDAHDIGATGVGARTLRIFGLDDNFNMATEDIVLSGVNTVRSTNAYQRIYRAYVLSAGDYQTNSGVLTCQQVITSSNIFFKLPAGYGQTEIAAYTVPKGYTCYLRNYNASMLDNTANSALMGLVVRPFSGARRILRPFAISTTNPARRDIYGGEVLAEKTDIKMTCLSILNANADITADFELIQIKN